MCAQRLNPWDDLDEDVAPDEELPDYHADAAPAYEVDSFDQPLLAYSLRQYDRKIQILRAYGMSSVSYRITTNSFRVFSKKPEMEVLYTSDEMRQRIIAAIQFDKHGPLPWCPRAHFDYTEADDSMTVHTMESPNFMDWTFALDTRRYEWTIATQPSSLVLREMNSLLVIARFTYSPVGTQAQRGAEVGELVLFRDALTLDTRGQDMVVCSMMVPLTHMKKMGRMYHNPEQVMRVGSMPQELIPADRASSAGVSMI
jgi:hypothetical protein